MNTAQIAILAAAAVVISFFVTQCAHEDTVYWHERIKHERETAVPSRF